MLNLNKPIDPEDGFFFLIECPIFTKIQFSLIDELFFITHEGSKVLRVWSSGEEGERILLSTPSVSKKVENKEIKECYAMLLLRYREITRKC